jgi:hypothetical protein
MLTDFELHFVFENIIVSGWDRARDFLNTRNEKFCVAGYNAM